MSVSPIVSPFDRSDQLDRVLNGPSPDLVARLVASPDELALHMRIRHEVFVLEQAIFQDTDRDPHDSDGSTLHILGTCDDVAAGAVRIYPLGQSAVAWQGDRLSVLAAFRAHGLGKPLVRLAVRTAALHGGRVMHAHIQLANVRFFQRLEWKAVGEPELYFGLPHQGMEIDVQAHARD
jgi:putative N-acetyltransferase (TIGR04045 family)